MTKIPEEKEELLEYIRDNPFDLFLLPAKFKRDKEIVLAAIESATLSMENSEEGVIVMGGMHDSLKKNKEFSQKREEILEMIWNMEEEIMGKDN